MAHMRVWKQGAVDVVGKGSSRQVLESAKQGREGGTAAAGASDPHAYPGEKQHISEFLLWKGRIQPTPELWKVSKSLQADREAQHIKCVSSSGTGQPLRFSLCYNMQVGSHRKLAFLKDDVICTLKQFSIYEESSLILMSNDINLCFYKFSN